VRPLRRRVAAPQYAAITPNGRAYRRFEMTPEVSSENMQVIGRSRREILRRSKELYRKASKRHSERVICPLVNADEVGTSRSANASGGNDDISSDVSVSADETEWLSTQEAARRLGITPRTLYRFIDHGDLPAYRFGRVIRLRAHEVEAFIESSRIKPGELEHLYPEPVGRDDES
jgi:excisionase family DNA binding protein